MCARLNSIYFNMIITLIQTSSKSLKSKRICSYHVTECLHFSFVYNITTTTAKKGSNSYVTAIVQSVLWKDRWAAGNGFLVQKSAKIFAHTHTLYPKKLFREFPQFLSLIVLFAFFYFILIWYFLTLFFMYHLLKIYRFSTLLSFYSLIKWEKKFLLRILFDQLAKTKSNATDFKCIMFYLNP